LLKSATDCKFHCIFLWSVGGALDFRNRSIAFELECEGLIEQADRESATVIEHLNFVRMREEEETYYHSIVSWIDINIMNNIFYTHCYIHEDYLLIIFYSL